MKASPKDNLKIFTKSFSFIIKIGMPLITYDKEN